MSWFKKQKIRVCHLVSSLDIGGMENGVVNLANNYDREKFEIVICCLNKAGEMAKRLKPDVQVHVLGEAEGFSLIRVLKVARFFRQLDLDIVHTHAWGGGSFYGILGAKLAKIPVIINGEHGAFFSKKHQLMLQRFLFYLCDYNLSVSETLKEKISKILSVPASQITVIRNGVDTNKFHGNYSQDQIISRLSASGFSVTPNTFNIFIIGSLKPEKAQITLLKAVKRLFDMNKQSIRDKIRIFIVGDGSDLTKLQDYIASNELQNTVFFLGNRSDIPELLSIAHLLISTSIARHEGLSNVMLEAMSSGVPVIATNAVGTKEILRHDFNGFLIKEGDYAQLAKYIERLFYDREKLELFGKNAKITITRFFSLKAMVQNYEELYLKAINKS